MFDIALVAIAAFSAADPPSAPADRGAGERVCRGGGTRTLGSHIRTRRRCLTAEQWEAEDARRDAPATGVQITPAQNDGRAPARPG
jgi:hypothetical protein